MPSRDDTKHLDAVLSCLVGRRFTTLITADNLITVATNLGPTR